MVHLTYKGKPICEHTSVVKCQYSTRREAFDVANRKNFFSDAKRSYGIAPGACPHMTDGNTQEGRV